MAVRGLRASGWIFFSILYDTTHMSVESKSVKLDCRAAAVASRSEPGPAESSRWVLGISCSTESEVVATVSFVFRGRATGSLKGE